MGWEMSRYTGNMRLASSGWPSSLRAAVNSSKPCIHLNKQTTSTREHERPVAYAMINRVIDELAREGGGVRHFCSKKKVH
jgi:hypothetical protein